MTLALLALWLCGVASVWLAFAIGRTEGDRTGYARGVGTIVLNQVVREVLQ